MTNLQALAWVATAVSAIIAVVQLYKRNKQKKFEYITSLRNEFQNNKDMVDMFYEIDYETYKFDITKFTGNETEKRLDLLLGFFTNIAYLKKFGIMDEEQLSFFQYEIHSINTNQEVQIYKRHLIKLFDEQQIPFKFEEFFKLAEELERKK